MSSTPTSNEPSPLPRRDTGLNRRFILGLLALGIMIIAVGVRFLRPEEQTFAGEVALLDGTNVRIAAVTYGTNHIYGPPLARWTAGLPSPAQAVVKRFFGRHASAISSVGFAESQLVIWLHRWTNSGAIATNRSIYFNAFLADESGFVSGDGAYLVAGGSALEKLSFKAVPRRDSNISVGFFTWTGGGSWTNFGALSFANPVAGKYPEWTPEPVPMTKRVGDVEATLIRLSTGHGEQRKQERLKGGGTLLTFSTNRSNGRNGTVCHVQARSLSKTNETWMVTGVRVRDATGNDIGNSGMSWGGSYPFICFHPSLWPGEVWKLGCELKRTGGFTADELVTFQDIPLGAPESTNRLGYTTNVAGLSITLDQFIHRRPMTNSSWNFPDVSGVIFTHSTAQADIHWDLVSMKYDTGESAASIGVQTLIRERSFRFREIPANAKSATITLSVQQSRWVEFLVKPEVGTGRIEIPLEK